MYQFTSARNAFFSNCVRGVFSAIAFVCLLSVFVSSGVMQSKSDDGTTANLMIWTNNQPAVRVLGQTDFITVTNGTGNNKFNAPIGVVVDSATGKVFVADFFNNRVLRFTSVQAATNGGAAEAVLGQPDFTTVSAGTTQSKMNGPQGVSVDSAGRLWVAESGNRRVLRFDNAATKASGANADGVLGQPNFTTNTTAAAQNRFSFSTGVFADTGGRLWVADQVNNRVLRFDNAAAKANGANADGVLGQTLFTINIGAATQNGMLSPTGLVVDSAGRLWVADRSNSRVLRFDNAAAKANGANADGVLGQPDFTTNTATVIQNRMNNPVNPTVDLAGRLYVPDRDNNRILIFDNAAALANGANASNVLGQSGFTTATVNNGGISASSLSSPRSLFFDEASQNLFVPDAGNNRVLRFVASPVTAASVSVSGRVLTPDGRGLRNARVVLTGPDGNTRSVMTGSFGYFSFTSVEAGETYVVSVASKLYSFSPQAVSVTDEVTGLDFHPEALVSQYRMR